MWPESPAARAYARVISAEMHAGFRELRMAMPMSLFRPAAGTCLTDAVAGDIARIALVLPSSSSPDGGRTRRMLALAAGATALAMMRTNHARAALIATGIGLTISVDPRGRPGYSLPPPPAYVRDASRSLFDVPTHALYVRLAERDRPTVRESQRRDGPTGPAGPEGHGGMPW